MKVCAAFALAAALAGGAQGSEAIRIAETHTLDAARLPSVPSATHALRLYLYTFQGTRWRAADAMQAAAQAALLLAQCGVTLESVELRVLEAPRRFHFYFTPVSRELLRSLDVTRPAIFFVEDTRNNPAFDAEAIGRGNARARPELENTIWIAHGARDLALALAHELLHVLSDSGEHSTEPGNLMRAETSADNVKLTAAQCERIRSRGVESGLLQRLGRMHSEARQAA